MEEHRTQEGYKINSIGQLKFPKSDAKEMTNGERQKFSQSSVISSRQLTRHRVFFQQFFTEPPPVFPQLPETASRTVIDTNHQSLRGLNFII